MPPRRHPSEPRKSAGRRTIQLASAINPLAELASAGRLAGGAANRLPAGGEPNSFVADRGGTRSLDSATPIAAATTCCLGTKFASRIGLQVRASTSLKSGFRRALELSLGLEGSTSGPRLMLHNHAIISAATAPPIGGLDGRRGLQQVAGRHLHASTAAESSEGSSKYFEPLCGLLAAGQSPLEFVAQL